MAIILYISTNGSENPTKAAFPFFASSGAADAGHQSHIVLVGDAVVIMKDAVANAVLPVGWPPLKDLMATAAKNQVLITV